METKKSKSAELESKRSSFLIIGLVCATSLTLMSFEYTKFNLVSKDIASMKNEDVKKEDFIDIQPVEILKLQPPKAKVEVNKEIIDVTEKIDPKPIDPVEPIEPTEPTTPTEPSVTPPVLPTPPIFVPVTTTTLENEFTVVEDMPEFPGGEKAMYKFLSKNVKYPTQSKNIGKEGKVYVSFVVEKDGSISNVEIVKGVDKHLDKEASRVIESMPNWKPGKQRNQLVRVRFVLPISFKLE